MSITVRLEAENRLKGEIWREFCLEMETLAERSLSLSLLLSMPLHTYLLPRSTYDQHSVNDNSDDDAQEQQQEQQHEEYGEEGALRVAVIDDDDGGLAGAADGAHKREGSIRPEP